MKTVLITGAGTGFGNEAAMRLAKKGFDVIAAVEIYPQVEVLENQAKERGVKLKSKSSTSPARAIAKKRSTGTWKYSSTMLAC